MEEKLKSEIFVAVTLDTTESDAEYCRGFLVHESDSDVSNMCQHIVGARRRVLNLSRQFLLPILLRLVLRSSLDPEFARNIMH